MCSPQFRELLSSLLCEYKSVRFIRIRNVRLAIIYWITMLLVLVYIVGFSIVYDRGYQDTDVITGTTSVKLKGSASIGDENGALQDLIPLDAMDLVQPAMEENAFFVVTARAVTPNQTRQMNCPGNDDVPVCNSSYTLPCTEQLYNMNSQGLYTGQCGANGRCEMYSWCPLENDSNLQIVNNVGAFTAFVKIDINFQKFDVSRNNIEERPPGNKAPVLGYNLFLIDDMLSNATNGEVTNVSSVAGRGAIILVSSIWKCNLDKDVSECNPTFEFRRIDGEQGTISSGFNYRTITYDTSETSRYLRKYYGLRFIFITEGNAGQFQWIALLVTFGAGLAYLSVAALVTDIVLERFLPESEHYMQQKTKELNVAINDMQAVDDEIHEKQNGYQSIEHA